jgi:hypothetical protein
MATSYLVGIRIRRRHFEIAIWYLAIRLCEEVLKAGTSDLLQLPAPNTSSHILIVKTYLGLTSRFNCNFKSMDVSMSFIIPLPNSLEKDTVYFYNLVIFCTERNFSPAHCDF